ncbi:MAG: Uncharacterised protein [Halieaceae bacterium]|nr:MAG: Uncharacterised protein [Halieaceae bacterium]
MVNQGDQQLPAERRQKLHLKELAPEPGRALQCITERRHGLGNTRARYGKRFDNVRITGFARRKHHVVQGIALVPDSKLGPEPISAGDGGVVLWGWRREWFQSFKCLVGFFLKKSLALVWLIIEVLHKRLQAVLGLG